VFGVTCTLDYDARVVVERPLAATNLYRIAQEAISNAVRHGGGRHITISLACQDGCLLFSVADDGIGLDRHREQQGGLGLGIMKHRAEMLGGTLDVRSDGTGTRVVCVVPGVANLVPTEEMPGP
jgi:signal transduction histidine kinase